MGFSEHLRLIDTAIANKNHQEVVDLCNEYFSKSNYSLLLAEKRGDALFNLQRYEEASIDFHNVLEVSIHENECRLKLALINNFIDSNDQDLLRETVDYLKLIIEDSPEQVSALETLFGKKLIDFIIYGDPKVNNLSSDHLIQDAEIGYNEKIYRAYNKDLKNLESGELFQHYKKHGIFEKRISSIGVLKKTVESLEKKIPKDFKVLQYSALNADLRKAIEPRFYGAYKKIKYMEHYIGHGTDGRRSYSYPEKLKIKVSDLDQFRFDPLDEKKIYNDFLGASRAIRVNPLISKKPKVSILITFPKEPLNLINLLLSIENQIENSLEVFVLSDVSRSAIQIHQICKKSEITVFDSSAYPNMAVGLNAVAKEAGGEILLFLNANLKIESNLVNEIIKSFQDHINLGVLGGKILKDYFSIDSYGGILSSNGETNYRAHEFGKDSFWTNFVQNVDFIPSMLLATKKKAFKAIGGFDEQLTEINSLCADYCMRAKESGSEILVNPFIKATNLSDVVPHAHRSPEKIATSDISILKDRYFRYSSHQENSEDLSGIALKIGEKFPKRILFIDDALPDPIFGSGFGRAKTIIDIFLARDAFVTHVSTGEGRNTLSNIDEQYVLSGKPIEFIRFCNLEKLACVFSRRNKFYDCVVVSRRHNIEYYLKFLRDFLGEHTLIFDVEALFSVREYLSESGLHFGRFNVTDFVKSDLLLSELEVLKYANYVWFASKFEKKIYEDRTGLKAFEVGHIASKSDVQILSFEFRNGALFLGSIPTLDSPNADSIAMLIQDILPVFRKVYKSKESFYIAGNIWPVEIIQSIKDYCKGDPNTYYLGVVDDLQAFLKTIKVFIAPTRVAAGIPHKLTEVSRYAIPILTSELIAQQVNSNDYFLTANSSSEFASNLDLMCSDKSIWSEFSKKSSNYLELELNAFNYTPAFDAVCN